MLSELFDKDCRPVAWTDGQNVFDRELAWVAFVSQGNAFSIEGSIWLGPVKGLSHQDRAGKVVAWNPMEPPANSVVVAAPGARPTKPMAPGRPLSPVSTPVSHPPREPLGGWSGLSFEDWLNQRA